MSPHQHTAQIHKRAQTKSQMPLQNSSLKAGRGHCEVQGSHRLPQAIARSKSSGVEVGAFCWRGHLHVHSEQASSEAFHMHACMP
jgi:hypothetical protein